MLLGEADVQSGGASTGVDCTSIGGFHDTGAATGDDREAGFAELAADLAGELVGGIVFGDTGGAEDGDRRAELGEDVEAHRELGHDAEHAPGLSAGLVSGIGLHRRLRGRLMAGSNVASDGLDPVGARGTL